MEKFRHNLSLTTAIIAIGIILVITFGVAGSIAISKRDYRYLGSAIEVNLQDGSVRKCIFIWNWRFGTWQLSPALIESASGGQNWEVAAVHVPFVEVAVTYGRDSAPRSLWEVAEACESVELSRLPEIVRILRRHAVKLLQYPNSDELSAFALQLKVKINRGKPLDLAEGKQLLENLKVEGNVPE